MTPTRAEAILEQVRAWAESRYSGEGDYYAGVDAAQEAVLDILDGGA